MRELRTHAKERRITSNEQGLNVTVGCFKLQQRQNDIKHSQNKHGLSENKLQEIRMNYNGGHRKIKEVIDNAWRHY